MSNVGVVFVHGIGNQGRGDILTSFGDPIVNWLKKKYQNRKIELKNYEFDSLSESTHSATVELEVESHKLFMTEAWWADSYSKIQNRNIWWWIVKSLPIVLINHFADEFIREGSLLKKGWVVIKFLLSLFVSPVFLLVVLLSSLLSRIPIPYLQGFFKSIKNLVRDFIGDSYFLLNSEIRSFAMGWEIVSAMQLLRGKGAEKIIIVCHSQGASITHRLFSLFPDHKTDLIISCGSGLKKLERLEINHSRVFQLMYYTLYFCIINLNVGSLLFWYHAKDAVEWTNLHFLLGLNILIFAVYALVIFIVILKNHRGFALSRNHGLKWLDLYSRNDVVPNGPITNDNDICYSQRVANSNSIFSDHNLYSNNYDEVISRICYSIITVGKWWPLEVRDYKLLSQASTRRSYRFRWRTVFHSAWIVMIATLVALGELYSTTYFNWIHWSIEQLSLALSTLLGSVQIIQRFLLNEWTTTLIAFVIGYSVITAVSNMWHSQEENTMIHGRGIRFDPLPNMLLILIVVLLFFVFALVPDSYEVALEGYDSEISMKLESHHFLEFTLSGTCLVLMFLGMRILLRDSNKRYRQFSVLFFVFPMFLATILFPIRLSKMKEEYDLHNMYFFIFVIGSFIIILLVNLVLAYFVNKHYRYLEEVTGCTYENYPVNGFKRFLDSIN